MPRATCSGERRAPASPEVLRTPEEFRKEGGLFEHARCVIAQGRDRGRPLIEEVWNEFISGEKSARR
eukprot:2446594-Alexandrium_andersonii.AAC.1